MVLALEKDFDLPNLNVCGSDGVESRIITTSIVPAWGSRKVAQGVWMADQSDKEWERYGGTDPYYGVLAEDQYRQGNLGQAGLELFFRTGQDHIDHVLETVKSAFGLPELKRGLDFGCGVGRLVIPMSRRFSEVVGLDISESMLKETRKNCEVKEIKNVLLELSDDGLTRLKGNFQFIHSFIVFQHINPGRGTALFEKLVDHVAPGGVGAIQFCYHIELPWKSAMKRKILRSLPWLHAPINILKKRPWSYPLMEMNEYDCNRLLSILQRASIHQVKIEFTDHAGHWGAIIYFRKDDPGPRGAASVKQGP